jgi:hypothetical protein
VAAIYEVTPAAVKLRALGPEKRLYTKPSFVEEDQRDLGCPVPFAEIIPYLAHPNHRYKRAVSSHQEGRIAIATNAGRDAMDADALLDEQRMKRTAKSCGPDASTLASSSWNYFRWRR